MDRPCSEIDDHDPAIVVFVRPVGLNGRSMHVQRKFETRLFRV